MNQPREDQLFKLPDGRLLGYAEFGDPNGKPLLYFHGYPSCRLEPKVLDKVFKRRGIRLISMDRPGFGLSSPQPGRQLLDWTRDVDTFTKGLELDKFGVIGLSGGGPYALAVAYALPRNRLSAVGLFASGPPWAAGIQHVNMIRRTYRWLAINWPSGLTAILNATVGLAKWISSRDAVKNFIEKRFDAIRETRKAKEAKTPTKSKLDDLSGSDQTNDDPEESSRAGQVDELVKGLLAEPFAQGAAATVQEAVILSNSDWGFKLEDVAYPNVEIWHGQKDKQAPIEMIRYLARKVPNCNLHEFDKSHFSLVDHLEELITKLTNTDDANLK